MCHIVSSEHDWLIPSRKMTDGAWELDVYPEAPKVAPKVLSFCLSLLGLAQTLFVLVYFAQLQFWPLEGKALKYHLRRWCFVEGKPKTFLK